MSASKIKVNYLTRLKQIIVKEQIIGELQLSHIEHDFYKNLDEYRQTLSKEDLIVIDEIIEQVFRARCGKILHFVTVNDAREFRANLTDEEFMFWEKVRDAYKFLKTRRVLRYE